MDNIKTFSASLTSVGRKRQNNEDCLAYYDPDNLQEYAQSGKLYIVADGVGGAAKGERASRYAAEKVLFEYYQMPQMPPGKRLCELMREAGNQIYQYAEEESFGRMATTMVAAVIKDDGLLVAHVGDSRAYLIRYGQVKQLTHDHSLVGEMIRDGVMTEEEALVSKAKNRLTRSLGGEENVQIDLTAEIPLEPGDRILLCTDGLTRYALPADLLEMVSNRSPAQAVQSLINFANQRGGADNVTAIVISVHAQDDKVDWATTPTPPLHADTAHLSPVAAPPPPIVGSVRINMVVLLGLALVAGVLFLFANPMGMIRSQLAAQMLLLTVSICFTPTITNVLARQSGRVARVVIETTLFITILIVFSLWIFGWKGLGSWIIYAIGLTLA